MVDLYPEYDNAVLVLNPLGRIDGTNAKAFEEALLNRIEAGDHNILMNFEGINYISSAGLRVLLMAAKRTSQSKGQLALCAVQDHIQEVFKFSGFAEIIPIHDDRPAALNTF